MDQKKRRRSPEPVKARGAVRRRSRERRDTRDGRYRDRTRRDSYSYSRSRSRDRKGRKSERYRDRSRSRSYSNRSRDRDRGKRQDYGRDNRKYDNDRQKGGRRDRRTPSYSKSRSPSHHNREPSYEAEYSNNYVDSKVDRLVSKLTGKEISQEENQPDARSSYSSRQASRSYTPSQEREKPAPPPKQDGHPRDLKTQLAPKSTNPSNAAKAVQPEKPASGKFQKTEQAVPASVAKDQAEQKGTGLFLKPSQKKEPKPKVVLARPQITVQREEKKVVQLSSQTKRSTPAFEIIEYTVPRPRPEQRDRLESGSLLQRITKKDTRASGSGSSDIRSRIIKKTDYY